MDGRNHPAIKVTIANGRVQVAPPRFHMKVVDTVSWESTNGKAFTVEFDNNRDAQDKSPFGAKTLRFNEATTPVKPRREATTDVDYKYTVISDDDPNVKEDPVIVIDPPT